MNLIERLTTAGRAAASRAAASIRAVAAAIDLAGTAQPLRTAITREQWLTVGQEVTTAMLEGADVEDALSLIASRLRDVAAADAACLVLEGIDGQWLIEIADGETAADLVGIAMPDGGRARAVLASRSGLLVPSLERTQSLRVKQFGRFGPALYAPMVVAHRSIGVIILMRARGAQEFTPEELQIAESFARQAALALELSLARDAQDRANLLDERARIARDLHDLAIQHLFATGLSIARARDDLPPEAAPQLDDALGRLDEAVAQIRQIVHALHRDAVPSLPMVRIERELTLSRSGLGFEPVLHLTPSSMAVEAWTESADIDLIDDVVAVIREGLSNAARHSRATAVDIGIDIRDEAVQVTVTDNGIGIPADRSRSSGLANINRRAQRWGGAAEVNRGATGGTVLLWSVPR